MRETRWSVDAEMRHCGQFPTVILRCDGCCCCCYDSRRDVCQCHYVSMRYAQVTYNSS